MRLDQLLVNKKILQSRQRAKNLIESKGVLVSGKIAARASANVSEDVIIEIIGEDIPWVSRAGLKLEKALAQWNIDVQGMVCADFGACTGGFTEVLLTNHAEKVYAIDVGHGQLAEKLKFDSRVINLEGTHLKAVSRQTFTEPVDFVCIDVSFISLETILRKAHEILSLNGRIVALIKPQFEVGKKLIKKGIVSDPILHKQAIAKIREISSNLSLTELGFSDSPILGGKGNKEFLIYLEKHE